MSWARDDGGSTITALLGPTNTGKTHRAIERLLEHESGLIGLPLRLLAREVYDRVTARVGESQVALVTGEEKRIPPHPRYWICTVEAMPDREVDFLAVDEVQLAAHRERGHVFTDRLLHARGRRETWFLGSDTMRPLLERLVPTARFESRPRLSTLTGAGSLALGALPPRTAVVAFSASRVYELAARLRARRGGAAVVLGALSPRARNAQVALYQSGEVDYLVATDAIGMGLNMDVDVVAFADLRKFDGRETRELDEAELAQVAGRAGRHHRDGRFATLAPLPALAPGVVRALERHRFPAHRQLWWRSRDLDMGSLDGLLTSLRAAPRPNYLELAGDAEDQRALLRLAKDAEVRARAVGQPRIELLWQVCQIPDYRQLQLDDHHQLQAAVYLQLTGPRARLDADWIDRHVGRLDDPQGDMDTLLARMAAVRTWTYITHHPRWVDDAVTWQARTRGIEDRLSDALHDELVRRFVDVGGKRGRGRARPAAEPAAPRALTLAEQLREKVIGVDQPEAERDGGWVDELIEAGHEAFRLDETGKIFAADRKLGRLVAGPDPLRPDVVLSAEDLGAGARLRLHRRLLAYARDLVAELLAPLTVQPGETLSAASRGLLYLVQQGLGTAPVRQIRDELRNLAPADRNALTRRGLRLGRKVVFHPALLRPPALLARHALVTAQLGPGWRLVDGGLRPDAVSFRPNPDLDPLVYTALGFPVVGGRAIRADVLEVIHDRLTRGAPDREIASRLGCSSDEAIAVRRALVDAPPPRRAAAR